jgi:PKD repeat protein
MGQNIPPTGLFSGITAGGYHACGIRSVGIAACWGSDAQGQAAPPDRLYSEISGGFQHNCAIHDDGTAGCWGLNMQGQAPMIVITPDTLPIGTVDVYYSAVLRATGGISTYTFTLVEGELPDGLVLTPTGTLSGTPTAGGSYTFKVQATDSRTGFPFSAQIEYTLEINGPPVVNAGADLVGNEGYEIYFTAVYTDTDVTAADPVSILWDFGDGFTATGTLTPTHTYGDNGTFGVTVTITDSLGLAGSDTLEVSVSNLSPTLDPIANRTVLIETLVTIPITFSEPGWLDTHQVDVDWGDGDSDTINLLAGVLTANLTHTYLTPADYTVQVIVRDDDGAQSSRLFTMRVLAEYYRTQLPLVVK